ncbi:MAG: hypothetical protein E7510_10345 [Ruminococcus sp.]|nr:hypothetical protein [Ruminococcus sp.]
MAGAAVGQNVVYSVNGGYDQLSGRGALQESFSTVGNDKSSPKKVKKLREWLSDDKDLLEEVTKWYNDSPEWRGIDPDKTDVFYRLQSEVREIRKKPGESGGHHPHGLGLGGPEGQKTYFNWRNSKSEKSYT